MERVTLHTIRSMKERGERITMLTAYDYPTALLLDEAGVDMLLVGTRWGWLYMALRTRCPLH